MKLKFNKSISESVVTVNLSLTNLTTREKKALRILGAPTVVVEKAYEISGTTVDIDQSIDDFSVEMDFTGTIENITEVLDEASTFITDVHEVITDVMTELMTSYKSIEKAASQQSGELEIKDGEQSKE